MDKPVVETLRQKHPRFIYESFRVNTDPTTIDLSFNYLIEPGLKFTSKVKIPIVESNLSLDIQNLAFHLGLIEMINYWKATCSPKLIIKAGSLTSEQIKWWRNLIIKGLGEFFFINQIDFKQSDFLSIETEGEVYKKINSDNLSGDLIMVGGGKESAVTLELLKNSTFKKKVFMMNPIQASLDIVREANYEYLVAQRQIDHSLFELNKQGYLNGHVPFSAFLAFLGGFGAIINGFKNVIVCNEKSAGEGNVSYLGEEINHQYSKSLEFENFFREYFLKYINGINYFSILRPFNSIDVSKLFAKFKNYHRIFRSCNIGSKSNKWCGNCPKCASVYLSLFPFISYSEMLEIFGEDYFQKENLQEYFRALVGLAEYKPFECVGTIEESQVLLKLSVEKYIREKGEVPKFLSELLNQIDDNIRFRVSAIDFNSNHFIPEDHIATIKQFLNK